MPRSPRIELAGGLHHVTAKTVPGLDLFADDTDRRAYLVRMRMCAEDQKWAVLSYCLMSNHVHLLVRTPEPDLGAGIKRVHEIHAMQLNRRERRRGHVFCERFFNAVVSTDSYAQGCMRYIARNPLKAGLCTSAADWVWSSHRTVAGLAAPDPLIDVDAALAFFGNEPESARRSYIRAVAASDAALVGELAHSGAVDWVAEAVDDYGIELSSIAQQFGWSASTAYRRLRAARDSRGTVLRRSQ